MNAFISPENNYHLLNASLFSIHLFYTVSLGMYILLTMNENIGFEKIKKCPSLLSSEEYVEDVRYLQNF